MRKKRGKKALLKTAGHLAYEIQLFHYAYISYSQPVINKDNLLRSTFIESFILHTRNLYEFFYRRRNKPPRPDDVIVEDFLNNQNLRIFKRNRTNKARIDKVFSIIRANKELAHLSYYRLRKTPRTKQWQIPQIYDAMHQTIKAFLNIVDTRYREKMLTYLYLNLFI